MFLFQLSTSFFIIQKTKVLKFNLNSSFLTKLMSNYEFSRQKKCYGNFYNKKAFAGRLPLEVVVSRWGIISARAEGASLRLTVIFFVKQWKIENPEF